MLLRNEQGKALNLKETEHKFHVLFPGGKKTKEDTPKPGTPVLDAAARGWGRGRRFHEEPAPCVRKYVLAKTMSRRGSGTSDTGSREWDFRHRQPRASGAGRWSPSTTDTSKGWWIWPQRWKRQKPNVDPAFQLPEGCFFPHFVLRRPLFIQQTLPEGLLAPGRQSVRPPESRKGPGCFMLSTRGCGCSAHVAPWLREPGCARRWTDRNSKRNQFGEVARRNETPRLKSLQADETACLESFCARSLLCSRSVHAAA